jgi:hypothetical protein
MATGSFTVATMTGPRKITHVRPDSEIELRKIANAVVDSGSVIVVTGAGISTNAGIPVGAYIPLFLLMAHWT